MDRFQLMAAARTADAARARCATSRCRPAPAASPRFRRRKTLPRPVTTPPAGTRPAARRRRPAAPGAGYRAGAAFRAYRPAPARRERDASAAVSTTSLSTVTTSRARSRRAVARGVMKNGEQPRPQVRPRLELIRRTERLQIRFLHEIFGVGRTIASAAARCGTGRRDTPARRLRTRPGSAAVGPAGTNRR